MRTKPNPFNHSQVRAPSGPQPYSRMAHPHSPYPTSQQPPARHRSASAYGSAQKSGPGGFIQGLLGGQGSFNLDTTIENTQKIIDALNQAEPVIQQLNPLVQKLSPVLKLFQGTKAKQAAVEQQEKAASTLAKNTFSAKKEHRRKKMRRRKSKS